MARTRLPGYVAAMSFVSLLLGFLSLECTSDIDGSTPNNAFATREVAPTVLVVSPKGVATGKGTRVDPLDLKTGLRLSRPDVVVELLGGVYRIQTSGLTRGGAIVYFGNDVVSGATKSVIRAAAGERVIITKDTGYPPYIAVNPYTRIEGIWFGGTKDADVNGGVITVTHDVEMEGCVVFGYYGGIADGGESHNLYRENLFVNCGTGELYHSLYISGQPTDSTRGCTVERNVFIGGGGYHIHLWHQPRYTKVLNNFSGDAYYALVVDGNGIVARDNILWSNRGQPVLYQGGNTNTVTFTHNLIGKNVTYYQWIPYAGSVADSNNFVSGAKQYPFGTHQMFWPESASPNALNETAQQVNASIASLELSFGSTPEVLLNDGTVATAWRVLMAALKAWATPLSLNR